MDSYGFKSSCSFVNNNGKCSGGFKAKDTRGLNIDTEATGEDLSKVLQNITKDVYKSLSAFKSDKKTLDKMQETFAKSEAELKDAANKITEKVNDALGVSKSNETSKKTCSCGHSCDKHVDGYEEIDFEDYVVELEDELESVKIDNKVLEQRVADLQKQLKSYKDAEVNAAKLQELNTKFEEALKSINFLLDDLN